METRVPIYNLIRMLVKQHLAFHVPSDLHADSANVDLTFDQRHGTGLPRIMRVMETRHFVAESPESVIR